MNHRFKVGQRVRLSAFGANRGAAGVYKVLALLPEERGDRQYRVQHVDTWQQRVVLESDLTSAESL